jgi:hypothetical protein
MRAAAVLSLLAMMAPLAPAQDSQGPRVYKVELTIHDGTDSAARTGRRYSLLMEATGKGSFKIGNRVPVATGSFSPGVGGVGVNPLVNTQFTFVDVGVNIDCLLQNGSGDKMTLQTDLDLSTIIPPDKTTAAAVANNPTISQLKIHNVSTISLGKPTTVVTVDDPVTMRKFDVEATITRVN